MNNWSLSLKTHTRNDVMKICAILAQGIGHKRVQNDCIQINIFGNARCGKSAIADGITAAFADNYMPYALPRYPLLEDKPGDAFLRDVKRVFPVEGKDCMFTLGRRGFHRYQDPLDKKYARLFGRFNKVSNRGVDFHTSVKRTDIISDIFISFFAPINLPEPDYWERDWFIRISAYSLKTPQMSQALENLRNFHEQRQMRILNDLRRTSPTSEI